MKQEYGTLKRTAALFTAANISSKMLKLLIIPLYTYHMTTAQFGMAETISVTASLLCPVLLLGTNEAAIRFPLERIDKTEDTASNCFAILLFCALPVLLICILLGLIDAFEGHTLLLYLIIVSGAFEALMMSLAKGTGRNGVFAASEIVAAVILIISNVIALVVLNAGTEGYLWSLVTSSAARCVFIEFKTGIVRKLSWKYVSVKNISDILRFSLPLMPNALLWWIMDSSDRYIILWMLGASSVGKYAIACRLYSGFIGLIFIFHQAWQLSAIRQFFSEDYKTFYKTVSDAYVSILFTAAAAVIPFVRPLISILDDSYDDAWKYAPLLLTAAVFAGLSSFAGVNYTASGKTKGALITTIAGAAINLVLNVILTSRIGIQGAVIATFISYYVLWLLRMIYVRKQVGGLFSFALVHVNTVILLAESACVLLQKGWYGVTACLLLLVFVNIKLSPDVFRTITRLSGHRNNDLLH